MSIAYLLCIELHLVLLNWVALNYVLKGYVIASKTKEYCRNNLAVSDRAVFCAADKLDYYGYMVTVIG